jgi:soluble lytic murein transglycosylase-like protein
MPFWVKLIGAKNDNLFDMRKNIRYGCTILRHYLELEKGDLYRALGRYNGSLGRPEYPRAVEAAWKNQWRYDGKLAGGRSAGARPARRRRNPAPEGSRAERRRAPV